MGTQNNGCKPFLTTTHQRFNLVSKKTHLAKKTRYHSLIILIFKVILRLNYFSQIMSYPHFSGSTYKLWS